MTDIPSLSTTQRGVQKLEEPIYEALFVKLSKDDFLDLPYNEAEDYLNTVTAEITRLRHELQETVTNQLECLSALAARLGRK